MKITKVETFLVRWGDVSQPAEALLGSTSATADQKIDSGPRPPAWSHTQTATQDPRIVLMDAGLTEVTSCPGCR